MVRVGVRVEVVGRAVVVGSLPLVVHAALGFPHVHHTVSVVVIAFGGFPVHWRRLWEALNTWKGVQESRGGVGGGALSLCMAVVV